jgi:hypothetical protein
VLSETNVQGEISFIWCKLERFCKNEYNEDCIFVAALIRAVKSQQVEDAYQDKTLPMTGTNCVMTTVKDEKLPKC